MAATLLGVMPVTAECVTPQQWRERIAGKSPALVVAPLEQANSLLSGMVTQSYNAKPPESDLAPDAVYMLTARDRRTLLPLGHVVFALAQGGCVVGTYRVPLNTGPEEQSAWREGVRPDA